MRFCKYCGSQIPDGTNICPNCGKDLAKTSADKTKQGKSAFISGKNKYYALGIAAVVIIIAIVVIASQSGRCKESGCNNKAVAGSKYCYTHKCSISGCDNSRYVYSNYCYSHYLLYDDDAKKTYTPSVYSYELKISNVTLSTSYGYTYAEGTLTNNSSSTVSFVKIKGSFKTSSGTVVDTDWTYAVGSDGLAPGESCKWKMSVTKDYSIKSCDVTILDFDY